MWLLDLNQAYSSGTLASLEEHLLLLESGTTKIAFQVRALVVAFEHPRKSIKLSVGVLSDCFNWAEKTRTNLRRCDASAQIDLNFADPRLTDGWFSSVRVEPNDRQVKSRWLALPK